MMHVLGSKINQTTTQISEEWNKLMKVNPNNMKMLRMQAAFLLDIMNDERGQDLEERAKLTENSNFNRNISQD